MDKEVKCEKCNSVMDQIGPFASLKIEGQPVKKWDGVIDFECANEKCENLGQITKVNT